MADSSASNSEVVREDLVKRLRAGDRQALAELFSIYRGPLRRMVSFRLDRRLSRRVDPSDVLQEVYIDAEQRVQAFLGNANMPFFLWLRLITGRRLLELHRQHLGAQMRAIGQEVSLDQGDLHLVTSTFLAAHLAAALTSPSHAAMRAEAEEKLEQALSQMDPIDREVLALRHFEELSNNEAAEALGLTKAGASNRYVRALKRLKGIMSEMDGMTAEETP